MSIPPGLHDFTIYQGATFQKVIFWRDENNQPIDITGFTATFQAATYRGRPPFLSLTTDQDGGIAIDGPNGTLTLTLDALVTDTLTPLKGIYELNLITPSGDNIYRRMQGRLQVMPKIGLPLADTIITGTLYLLQDDSYFLLQNGSSYLFN